MLLLLPIAIWYYPPMNTLTIKIPAALELELLQASAQAQLTSPAHWPWSSVG